MSSMKAGTLAEYRAQEVENMLEAGWTIKEICRELDLTPAGIARGFYRIGRVDLARQFNSVVRNYEKV